MNHCPHCGKALEEPCTFCPYCGKLLPKQTAPKPASPPQAPKKAPKSHTKTAALLAIPAVIVLILAVLLTKSDKPFSQDTAAIAKASASVVTIYTYDVNNIPLAIGSGFAAFEEGIIVTNHHVIEGDTYRIEAMTESGTVMEAESVIAYDAEKDIAILRFYDCPLRCPCRQRWHRRCCREKWRW